jgi:catechol 2,3-dioxygenase-like lactoylglutathione lyase family enzyme
MTVYVRLIVRDVNASITFYTAKLGFVLVAQNGSAFAMVRRDDLELWLSGPLSSASRALLDGRKPAPGGWTRFVLWVDDLEASVATMRAAGITFRNDIVRGPGGDHVVIDDPDGNAIEIFQPNAIR